MKKSACIAVVFFCALPAAAQNWTIVTATNITDLNQQKLAAGQLCFLTTDQNDNPISIGIGGGGHLLKRQFCSAVANGAVTGFSVPNPAQTTPAGIYYRVLARDSSTGQEVLRYTQVTFNGASFNFDLYSPLSQGQFSPPAGNAVNGNLNVNGNITATGSLVASNLPANIVSTIDNAGAALTQRTSLNFLGGLQAADNAGSSRTDVRQGGLTTVTFSATPTFDASTANLFKITLTGNVTSSTLINAVAGEPLALMVCQDATGSRTFVPPTNVLNWVTIPAAANACLLETFYYDGANAQADGDTAGQVLAQDGSAAAPSVAFENSTGTGLFRTSGGAVDMSVLGGAVAQFQTSGLLEASSGVVGWTAGTNPNAAADTAISRVSAGIAGCGTGAAGNTAGECDMRTLGVTGSTSGKVSVVAPAAASGTLTLPAATDQLVGRATADTLTNKNLVAPQINGTTMSESPVVSWGTFIPGNLTIVTGVSQLTIPKAITILRFESITYANSPAGCTTNAVLNIVDQTAASTLATLTLTAQVMDSGALAINVPAGHVIRTGVATAAAGCTATPQNAAVEVQYRMQ
jgi:hypothetical protein